MCEEIDICIWPTIIGQTVALNGLLRQNAHLAI
jgi:hypothetical protein